MNITQEQFQRFCQTISRTGPGSRHRVQAALEDLGVEVVLTPQDRAVQVATQLIANGRAVEVRAALKLLGRARVSECTPAEAERLVDYFGDGEF
jgi:hypothetical protein